MRNFLLKITTIFATITCVLGILSLDSESWIPGPLTLISLAWVVLFSFANLPEVD